MRNPTLVELINGGGIVKVLDAKEPSGCRWVLRPDYDEWVKSLPTEEKQEQAFRNIVDFSAMLHEKWGDDV